MKKTLLLLALGIACLPAGAQQIKELAGFDSPESVLQHKQAVYVSNVGKQLQPTAKDGDGYITLLNAGGETVAKHFLPLPGEVLHAPKGMALLGNTLYVTDIDRVVGFNLKTRQKTFELSMQPVSGFLNDLEVLDRQHLLVTATDAGKVFTIDLAGKGSYAEVKLPEKIPGANGLKYDASGKRLYVNGFGENGQPNGAVYALQWGQHASLVRLSPEDGYYDGLALTQGTLWLTNWISFDKKGEIAPFDPKGGKRLGRPLPVLVGGPADIWLNEKQRVLWVPALLEGKVYRIVLDRL